ncbi:MAG: hypothetical protein ACHQK9_08500 [Reyranellales bacterium]
MLSVFRRLMKNEHGALTFKYTVISALFATCVALAGIVFRLIVVPARVAGG